MSGFSDTVFAGKRFAVVGLGKNGLPAALGLRAMGADVVAWDDNAAARAALCSAAGVGSGRLATSSPVSEKVVGGRAKPGHDTEVRSGHDTEVGSGYDAEAGSGHDTYIKGRLTVRDPSVGLFDFDALVLSPGIPHRLPAPHPAAERALAGGVPILSDVELLFQAVRASGSRARFVGITGTNGKSTTTALLAHILERASLSVAAGANLGPAALSLPLLPHHGVYVLEMSSYMLERLATVRFDAAVMLNLSADHIDRHGDMAGYAGAKRAVFDRQTEDDLAVVGVDDDGSRAMAASLGARVVRVSGADVPLARGMALPGAHNAQNAAAATIVARFLGVSDAVIAEGLASYPGLPHRQQLVATIDGVAFVNDSKATNADAAERALVCYDRVIWIAGGMAKEGGIEPLVPLFPRIAQALLIGRDAGIFAGTLTRGGVTFETVGTLEAAVPAAFAAAKACGEAVVLLSPACASWDQFTGYDQRGDRFAALVRGLLDRVVQTSGDSASGHHAQGLLDRVIQTSGDSASGHHAQGGV